MPLPNRNELRTSEGAKTRKDNRLVDGRQNRSRNAAGLGPRLGWFCCLCWPLDYRLKQENFDCCGREEAGWQSGRRILL